MPKEKKLFVLIIDDDPFLSEMYSTRFKQDKFEADVAVNGEEGFQKAKEKKPDLILLDVVMPKMDGFETLKALKDNIETKGIPVILLTNLGQREDVEKGLKLGADDYVIKAHFTPTEVLKRAEKVLESRKSKSK
ncbi:MAG: response regulator [Parcubacteria group bacterium]|nr:response regulator [Parcubacteria group bacterium]